MAMANANKSTDERRSLMGRSVGVCVCVVRVGGSWGRGLQNGYVRPDGRFSLKPSELNDRSII